MRSTATQPPELTWGFLLIRCRCETLSRHSAALHVKLSQAHPPLLKVYLYPIKNRAMPSADSTSSSSATRLTTPAWQAPTLTKLPQLHDA